MHGGSPLGCPRFVAFFTFTCVSHIGLTVAPGAGRMWRSRTTSLWPRSKIESEAQMRPAAAPRSFLPCFAMRRLHVQAKLIRSNTSRLLGQRVPAAATGIRSGQHPLLGPPSRQPLPREFGSGLEMNERGSGAMRLYRFNLCLWLITSIRSMIHVEYIPTLGEGYLTYLVCLGLARSSSLYIV
jgi:hypothetical protein